MTWERLDPDTLDLENHRRELVMVEEVLRQTAEYWDEVRRRFELDDSLTRDRYLYRAPSGGLYDIVFIGRTDEPFPRRDGVLVSGGRLRPVTVEGHDRCGSVGSRRETLWPRSKNVIRT